MAPLRGIVAIRGSNASRWPFGACMQKGDVAMGHNPRMATTAHLALVLACLAVTGCGREPSSTASSDAPIPGLGNADGETAWGGVLPCADCAGIETRLILQRRGDTRRYRLLEIYRAQQGNARFVEDGRWRQQPAGLLRLEGDQGARRAFAILRGGRLQPRDSAGQAFAGRDADRLMPLSDATPP